MSWPGHCGWCCVVMAVIGCWLMLFGIIGGCRWLPARCLSAITPGVLGVWVVGCCWCSPVQMRVGRCVVTWVLLVLVWWLLGIVGLLGIIILTGIIRIISISDDVF